MLFGFWTLAFVATLAITVVLTLVVENWGRWRQPVATTIGEHTEAASGQLVVHGDPDDGEELDLLVLQQASKQQAVQPPADARRYDALEVRLDGRAAADRFVAVLFASYATQRLPEANRVAAWVTASERPPSGDGSICDPGTSLRGRPAAVQRLLECEEDGRTWVALNEEVDIELGVSRRPPTCDVLGPLVELWRATRDERTELPGDAVIELAEAIDALRPTWSVTTGAAVVDPLAKALAAAAEDPAPHPLSLMVLEQSASGAHDRALPDRADGSDPDDAADRGVAIFA